MKTQIQKQKLSVMVLALALSMASVANAEVYRLQENCEVKELKNAEWVPSTAPDLSFVDLHPEFKTETAEFVLNDQRFLVQSQCLISTTHEGMGSDKRQKREKRDHVYLSALASELRLLTNSSNKKNNLGYGARFGVNVAHIGEGSLALGLNYHTTSDTNTILNTDISAVWNEYLFQVVFRDLGGSGFYIGPEVGFVSRQIQINHVTFDSAVSAAVGINLGYDFKIGKFISIGPDFELASISQGVSALGVYQPQLLAKGSIDLTFHF